MLQRTSVVAQSLPVNAGDAGSVLGSRRSPGRGKWDPTPVFLLREFPPTEEPGGLQSGGVTKSQTQLSTYHQLVIKEQGRPSQVVKKTAKRKDYRDRVDGSWPLP